MGRSVMVSAVIGNKIPNLTWPPQATDRFKFDYMLSVMIVIGQFPIQYSERFNTAIIFVSGILNIFLLLPMALTK